MTKRPDRLHPFCNVCGWRKGGIDSWDGTHCKCGESAAPIECGWIIDGKVYADRVEADRAYRALATRQARAEEAIAKAEGNGGTK